MDETKTRTPSKGSATAQPQADRCDYRAVCNDGPSTECKRVGPGRRCLCDCHPDSFVEQGRADDWKPAPLHQKAIDRLQVLADEHGLYACDPDSECYFPRCLADGCPASKEED